ncbi:MAG: GrpB family protein [Anaerolineae bacterium]|nr:GrpB family protein [Anaerolineae bacterium]
MSRPVVIVDYDPQWPIRYEEEKLRILKVIGDKVIDIQHVGSTAVPGLGAKPIVDIMVAIYSLDDAATCFDPLAAIGYQYVPEYEAFIPERRFFVKGSPETRTHHLHMVERRSNFWRDHLLFRDFLRTHPEVARRYHALKRELAQRYGTNRNGYTDAKGAFIEATITQAHIEAPNLLRQNPSDES